jgi:hypothetical protein
LTRTASKVFHSQMNPSISYTSSVSPEVYQRTR